MDIAVLLSGFFGLLAAFLVSALWATRPTPKVATNERLVSREHPRSSQRR